LKPITDTALGWIPTGPQLETIDLLATGYSQNAIARLLGIPVTTISGWIHEQSYAAQFREMVAKRTADFNAAKDSIHDQQVVMALEIIQEALSGEMRREPNGDSGSIAPLRYEAAIQLLRNTFWRTKGGGHKKFGPA
jgi:predicted transcriptional regulator